MIFIDSIQSDPIPSSFVKRELKFRTDDGHGEAKLYLKSNYSLSYCLRFFNNYQTGNRYFFSRDSLVNYLNSSYISGQYNTHGIYNSVSTAYRIRMISYLSSLNPMIELTFEKRSDLDSQNRYYIRSYDDIFRETFRFIALPLTTSLQIDKYRFNGTYNNLEELKFLSNQLELNSYVYILSLT